MIEEKPQSYFYAVHLQIKNYKKTRGFISLYIHQTHKRHEPSLVYFHFVAGIRVRVLPALFCTSVAGSTRSKEKWKMHYMHATYNNMLAFT